MRLNAMFSFHKRCTALFALFFSLISVSHAASQLPGPLVDAYWLADNIDNVVVLDVRKDVDSYISEGHISGSVLVNVKKVRVTRTIDGQELTRMLPEPDEFAAFMSAHGVSNDSTVVLTHRGEKAGNVAGAARLYWQLRYYGFDSVALLDGGNKAWTEALEELVSETADVTPGKFTIDSQREQMLATTQDVEQVVKSGGATLVDTRPLRFHVGLDKRDYVYAYGHIPGSRNFPYEFLNPEKGMAKYLPSEEVESVMAALHIDPQSPMVLYCNSAYECSSVWFYLHELMGNTSVSIYDGSLHEWTMDKSRPMTAALTR